jgi:hypothetical protein
MSDDWRVRMTFADHGDARDMAGVLEAEGFEHGVGEDRRVVVSVDDADLFVYADAREVAEQARDAVLAAAAKRGWHPHAQLRRWHPAAQEWLDAELDLPTTAAEHDEEHERLIAAERADAARYGFPEWEVRVTCRTARAAQQLAGRLREEGVPSLRRDRYLLFGATDEDAARTLADRLQGELGAGAGVSIEGTLPAVAARVPGNPFTVFGGLGA